MRWFEHLVRMPPGHLPREHIQLGGSLSEDPGLKHWLVLSFAYHPDRSDGLGSGLLSPESKLKMEKQRSVFH